MTNSTKKGVLKITITFLHTLVLLVFTWMWLNLPYTFGNENFFIQTSAVLKRIVLGLDDDRPVPDKFIFVNVSKDKTTVEYDNGERQMMVDRKRLAKLFEVLNRHTDEYEYVLCDIIFDFPSPDDALLQNEFNHQKKLLIASESEEYKGKIKFKKLILDAPKGLVEYVTTADEVFFKFELAQSQAVKSMPLLLYENLHGAKFKYGDYFNCYMDNALSLNSIVVDFKVRNYHLNTNEYTKVNLFELNALLGADEEEFFKVFLKDKIIIIGNYEDDTIETSFGPISGSLMLFNVYLDLLDQENKISFFLVLFLSIVYGLISYNLFYVLPAKNNSWINYFRKGRFARIFGHFLLLAMMSLFCYFTFGLQLNILMIVIYIEIVAFIVKLSKKDKGFKGLSRDFIAFFIQPKNTQINENIFDDMHQ